ncbi:hypothetical protein QE441_000908 [Chryseobacterium sp. SORGH_AS909]|uniref:Uncharacterized protein n=1 Tax=Chryseobacterium camelliae TaxID=1265445 RepID=A0ABU0TL25_9FLAO|nr:hypothetical protein [Chryseobacterium camelliae]MDQ1101674.1 hypothetical protein [Chryseobacterium sp. SORGH_AS_1048]MDR6085114.1 hypothetical protein [Chryseobacterium sp. SORGH_AS_0909]MDR6129470.1 hypothetical protein [Chryseobacterium sp. SORGH_AS_1175]MDT3408402.1 hypothetical protein [Pseudacidovorax intermedius]
MRAYFFYMKKPRQKSGEVFTLFNIENDAFCLFL